MINKILCIFNSRMKLSAMNLTKHHARVINDLLEKFSTIKRLLVRRWALTFSNPFDITKRRRSQVVRAAESRLLRIRVEYGSERRGMGSAFHRLCPIYGGTLMPTAPTAIRLWGNLYLYRLFNKTFMYDK